MRVKFAALTIAIASLVLLPSSTKADTFVYNVTSTFGAVDVTFDLPTFQESVTTTTFIHDTSAIGPLTVVSLSGNSAVCSATTFATFTAGPGPCFVGANATSGIVFNQVLAPSFTGPGTFTMTDIAGTATVTITDVPSAAPEPSSLILLGCGLFGLLALASFGSRIRRLAS
jgi:hypothetical protein